MNKGLARLDIALGVLLSTFVIPLMAYTAFYVTHTSQKDARLVGLPIPVETVKASVKLLHEAIGAGGAIQPSMLITVSATVTSRVLSVPVDLGDVVKPGDPLVLMDGRLCWLALEKARIEAAHAEKQLNRMQALAQRHFASAVELETARTGAAEARDAVIRAELAFAGTRLTSPVFGVVFERGINPGETTRIDQKLVQVATLDPAMMVVQVPEDKLGFIYLGMHGAVSIDAFPGESFAGTVAKIDPQVDDSTRTVAVYVRIPNHDRRLKKGLTGYARLEDTRTVLSVPSTAVMNPVGDRATLFVVTNGKAHLREMRQGLTVGGVTEVLSGLSVGEEVVTAGQFNLRDGELVSANHFGPWNKHVWR